MINKSKLLGYIEQYKKIMRTRIHCGEIFKGEAVQCFQDNWEKETESFGKKFEKATVKAGSLLAKGRFFPRRRFQWFAEKGEQSTRRMFADLFGEAKPLTDRVANFIKEAGRMIALYPIPGNEDETVLKAHFQNTHIKGLHPPPSSSSEIPVYDLIHVCLFAADRLFG